MTMQRQMRGVLACLLLLAASGCATVATSPLAGRLACSQRQCPSVCIIFVEASRDIGQWGRLPEICDYFRSCGADARYYDPWVEGCDPETLASWVRAAKCRGQKVMLVSWSIAALQSLEALEILADQGVCVDTYFEIDCFWLNLYRGWDLQPRNVRRVVLVRSHCNFVPAGFDCPVVHDLETCNHLQAPGHPTTVNALFYEAIRLGCRRSQFRSQSPPPEPVERDAIVPSPVYDPVAPPPAV